MSVIIFIELSHFVICSCSVGYVINQMSYDYCLVAEWWQETFSLISYF